MNIELWRRLMTHGADPDCDELDGGGGEFRAPVMAGRRAPEMFDAAEEALHEVARW